MRCPRVVLHQVREFDRMVHHRYFRRGLMCGIVLGVVLERHAIESWCSMVLMFLEAGAKGLES